MALSAGRLWGSKKWEAGGKRLGVGRRGAEKDCRSLLIQGLSQAAPVLSSGAGKPTVDNMPLKCGDHPPTFRSSSPSLWRRDTNHGLGKTLLAWDLLLSSP